jgi:HlyD family secretion protein
MDADKNLIFRQEALDNLSSPEELDQLMNIVKPQTWLPLISGGSLVVSVGIWSIAGRIPLTVNGSGVLVRPHSVFEIQAVGQGQLLSLNIRSRDWVKKGQVIGAIDQSNIKQQLQQERAKLVRLQQEKQESDLLQKQKIEQQLAFLKQQQEDLKSSLKEKKLSLVLYAQTSRAIQEKKQTLRSSLSREQITPKLYNQRVSAITDQSQILQQQKENLNSLLENLEEKQEIYRILFKQRAISRNLVLQSQQEVINVRGQVLDIDAKLKELEVQKTGSKREYLQNLSAIDSLENQLQELEVDKTKTELSYNQNLAKLKEIDTKIQGLEAEKTQLNQQNFTQSLDKERQIQKVKDLIVQLELQLSKDSEIVSQYEGRVIEIGVTPGQVINAGTLIAKIQVEDTNAKLQNVVYFADKDGKKIERGMNVQVTPSVVKREEYGGIIGKVTEVSPFPVTTQSIATVVGNDDLAKNLADINAARIQVFVDLEKDVNSQSGYLWSSSGGPDLNLSSGTTTEVRVKVGEVAPISYLMPILRSWTGIN